MSSDKNTGNQSLKLFTCYHCGNKTLMTLEASCGYSYWDEKTNFEERYIWNNFLCPSCHKITIEQAFTYTGYYDESGNPIYDYEVIYPYAETSSKSIPDEVRKAFDAALGTRNIDGAICALSLRRTLEFICKEKGEISGQLYEKLDNLVNKGILPPTLRHAASLLRQLGNAAAHADNTKFSTSLISSMIEFTKTIIDYVYILPAKLETIQKQIDKKS